MALIINHKQLIKPPPSARIDYSYPLSRGLIGAWLMLNANQPRLFDSSQFHNHGTFTGGPPWTMGRAGPCLDFGTKTGDYADIGNLAVFNVDFMTVSAWIFLRNTPDANSDTAVSRDDDTNRNFLLGLGGNAAWRFAPFIGNVQQTCQTSELFSLGVWRNIVGTYDGSAIRIFVDGREYNRTVVAGTIDKDPASLRIGNRASNNTANEWDGLLDDVRIWNRALIHEEVMELFVQPYSMLVAVSRKRYFFPPLLSGIINQVGPTDSILVSDRRGDQRVCD